VRVGFFVVGGYVLRVVVAMRVLIGRRSANINSGKLRKDCQGVKGTSKGCSVQAVVSRFAAVGEKAFIVLRRRKVSVRLPSFRRQMEFATCNTEYHTEVQRAGRARLRTRRQGWGFITPLFRPSQDM
jgi:hypothetical protein